MSDVRGSRQVEAFIRRWRDSGGAERSNCQQFLSELCDVLGVPRPDVAMGGVGEYMFERAVIHHFPDGSNASRRIDLYRRGRFVLEAKQGAAPRQPSLFGQSETERRANIRRSPGWTKHMLEARGQAENYARDLPVAEGYPPFLIVCDVGFCFDLYADFSGTGKHYAQFPDRERFRIYLEDLRESEHRETLRNVWEDPHELDPSRKRVHVTSGIAALLAHLATALEKKHPPELVATFLMRCIFCMFAQSVGLLPGECFTDLLEASRHGLPASFIVNLADLWRSMDKGGYSATLHATVRRFNGGLFRASDPLSIDAEMLDLLIQASRRDWANVEPAIFGTLLENALNPRERGQLGAYFTPRAFVERLVLPTVMEPLRRDWDGVKAAAGQCAESDRAGAAALVRAFHAELCQIRVLDPACGSGNFLYVTLELLKRLEGEVLDLLADLAPGEGDRLAISGASVDPHQFLGLEKNPRAVPVAELVLWIGYLQWHFRTHGNAPPAEPILRDFRNIQRADALLAYADEKPERDKTGRPVSRWDGRTFKTHPITGEEVPDETARELVLRPVDAKPAAWPEADFIVGNPPFIAGKDMRAELGEGYAKALWAAYKDVPRSADIALFFWWKAAALTRSGANGAPRRFGFITSNSVRQTFCRRVVAEALQGPRPLRLAFAIPDHPWSDGKGAAAVRIAMTVAERVADRAQLGRLVTVIGERSGRDDVPELELSETKGIINADLTIGTDVKAAKPLRANWRIASDGVKLHGNGFIVSPTQANALGLGKMPGLQTHIRPYRNGRDLQQQSRGMMVIDLFGLTEDEVRRRFPAVYQHVLLKVKPQRDQNNRTCYRDNWWIFGEPRRDLRPALHGLSRYIATVDTAKHRIFGFVSPNVIVDDKVVVIASDDAFHLGVLQSRHHVTWMLAQNTRLGVGNDPVYAKTQCFDPFPFPTPTEAQAQTIRDLAEELDAHRASRLAAHKQLTLTALYNVLAAIRAGRELTPQERDIHDAGQVSILRALHDRLDEAVAAAYGWPADLANSDILARLVALNAARRAEEEAGLVRWLRPEFQAPKTAQHATQRNMEMVRAEKVEPAAWPKSVPEQYVMLRTALAGRPAKPGELARGFAGAPRDRKMREMLETLVAMGQAHCTEGGRYVA